VDEVEVFLEALHKTSAQDRAQYLEQTCQGNDLLRQSVEQLLEAHDRAGQFLLGPPSGVGADSEISAFPSTDQTEVDGPDARIGPYLVIETLGEGGTGRVYLAQQEQPVRRRVALKVLKAGLDTQQVIARFEQERQALAVMDHPHIAKVFDAGTTAAGRPYFVMELVAGTPITQFCDQQQLTIRQRLELLVHVCQAVQHAHQKGVIHRDLKPSNVIVALYDGEPIPKVIDFGIAKAIQQKLTPRTMQTEAGQILGTLEYMAPEQADLANVDVDTRSDIYSLGVLLYELLTGSPPFPAAAQQDVGILELLRILREVEPVKPSARLAAAGEQLPLIAQQRKLDPRRLARAVAGDLDWIALKCLEKERARRYETASALAADLERYLRDEPVLAGPPSVAYRFRKFARRHKVAILAGSVVTVSLLAGLVGTSWQAIRAQRAERLAADEAAVALAVNQFLQDDLLAMAGADNQFRAQVQPDPDLKLRTLLERAMSRVDQRFADQPRVRAEVQYTLGQALTSIGRYHDAIRLLEQVRDYRQQTLGPLDPQTLMMASKLARVYREAGKYAQAAALGRQTLAAQRETLGLERVDTLDSMINVALAEADLGNLRQAVSLGEQALRLAEKMYGERMADLVPVMSTVGNIYSSAGRYQESLALHQRALKRAQEVSAVGDPWFISMTNNVAVALAKVGKNSEGERLLESALQQAQTTLGPEYPNTLMAMNNLAMIYRENGRLTQALGLLNEAIPLMRNALGQDHPDLLFALENQALTYEGLGDFDQAIQLHHHVLLRWRHILGPDHPATLQTMDSLAVAYGRADQFDKGLPIHEQTVAQAKSTLGTGHPQTLQAMRNLGYAYWHISRLDRSIEVLEEVRQLQGEPPREDRPDMFLTLAYLGQAYRDGGRVAEAIPLLEAAYRHYRNRPTHRWVGMELLVAYVVAAEKSRAAALAEELVSEYRQELPPKSLQLAGPLSFIAHALLDVQAWEAAESLLRELLLIEQRQRPDDWKSSFTQFLLGEALFGQQRFEDAESLLVQGYQGMKRRESQIPAVLKPRLVLSLERIIQFYDRWDKPEQAATWRAEWAARHAAADSAN
jgi:serine/threonine protein kinase/tetratricopeptide (TPR) repeat protein